MLSRVIAKNVGDVFLRHSVLHQFQVLTSELAPDSLRLGLHFCVRVCVTVYAVCMFATSLSIFVQCTEWPKISENTGPIRFYDHRFNAFKIYLFILLMMSHDIMCLSEFVLFNNAIIIILLFVKRRNCCSLLWYGPKSYSSYEFVKRQNVLLDDYRESFVINTVIWIVYL